MSKHHYACTHHANRRIVQRAIAPDVIDIVLDYGRVTRSRKADRYALDRKSRNRLREIEPELFRRHEKKLGTYAVVSDAGVIITAGYQTKRFHR